MRQILFRGKQLDNGEWVCGNYCKVEMNNHGGDEHFIIEYSCEGSQHHVDPKTVGQFTGFSDDNEVNIFEGDIVTYKRKTVDKDIPYVYDGVFIFTGVVEYEDCRFIASRERDTVEGEREGIDSIELSHVITSVDFYDGQIEVIGNIYDNPELLESV